MPRFGWNVIPFPFLWLECNSRLHVIPFLSLHMKFEFHIHALNKTCSHCLFPAVDKSVTSCYRSGSLVGRAHLRVWPGRTLGVCVRCDTPSFCKYICLKVGLETQKSVVQHTPPNEFFRLIFRISFIVHGY